MSDAADVFIGVELSLDEAAQELARVVGGEVGSGDDGVYVVAPYGDGGRVGGEVDANIFRDDDERVAWNGYPLAWTLRVGNQDEDVLRAASREVFDRLVAAGPPWPVLLVHNSEHLLAAARPGEGATEFPAGTQPFEDHRDRWSGYDLVP